MLPIYEFPSTHGRCELQFAAEYEAMKLGESIRHGTKWLVAGNLSGQALQFVFGIVLARLLTPSDFGLLVTTQIFTGFVAMFASGGMGEALVQAKEVREEDFQTVFTLQLATGVLIYAGFYLVAPWLARWFHESIYESILRVSALSFVLRPFDNNPRIRLRREMRFKETALITLVNLVFSSSISIAMAANGFGVWSLVLAGIIGTPISIALLSWRAPWRPVLQYSRASAKALASYGLRDTAIDLAIYFRTQTTNFIVAKLMSPGELGLFNKGSSLAYIPTGIISGSTYQVVFRALAKAQENLDHTRYIYFRTVTLTSVYTFPVYIALAWVTESFVVGVYGSNWLGSVVPLRVLCLAAPAFLLQLISGALVAARNRLAEEIWLQLQTWALLIVLGLIGYQFGIIGIAWVVVLAAYYIAIRLSLLALDSIGSGPLELLRALMPTLPLCGAEVAALFATYLLLGAISVRLPLLLHCAVFSLTGFAAYAAMFLFCPDRQLVAEANRWRGKLGLRPLGKV